MINEMYDCKIKKTARKHMTMNTYGRVDQYRDNRYFPYKDRASGIYKHPDHGDSNRSSAEQEYIDLCLLTDKTCLFNTSKYEHGDTSDLDAFGTQMEGLLHLYGNYHNNQQAHREGELELSDILHYFMHFLEDHDDKQYDD